MKKNLKNKFAKACAVVLATGLVVTSAPSNTADAKKKTPALNKTKVTITVGKTKTIKVKKNKNKITKKVAIKLTKKQKKIVSVSKKTKTSFKIKGKKAGTVTLKVKISYGKKSVTKKLKVTVKKAAPTQPPVVVTTPPASNAPTATPTATPGNGENKGTPTPSPTPGEPAEKENITLTYDYTFPGARQVKFEDAVSGYPAAGINVADYAKVIVKVAAAKEIEVVEDWAGKCTLSSTDEGYGLTAYTDGLATKFFNDMPYEDGMYTFEFTIPESLAKGWTMEDVPFIDCISVQLSGVEDGINSYADVSLKEISFLLPEGGDVTDPTPTPGDTDPTPVPVEETDVEAIGDLSVQDFSDITTLKASQDAEGTNVVRIPFTAKDQRVFFDVKDIDFTNIASIKVTADVPEQLTFNLWAKDLDTKAEKWWDNYMGADYPFWSGSSINRDEGGAPGDPGKETYTFDMTKLKEGMEAANIGYLSLGTNTAPGGKDPWATAKYMIYSIEFVQKEVSVTATAAKNTIEAGETTTITPVAKLAGEDTDATITYISSDDKVATVNEQGVVTAVAAGTATITVEASVAGITKTATATVEITVKEKSVDPSVELGIQTGAPTTIGTGLTTTLDVTVRNAADATVEYVFGDADTGTATVVTDGSGTTATVTGTKAGTVTVTAKITVAGMDYTSEAVEITVVDPTVTVSAKTTDRVVVGRTIELASETANAGEATVTYSSSSDETATVSDAGVVTGVKAGTATITAKITVGDKDYTDTIDVTVVNAPAEDITADLSAATGLANVSVSDAAADSVTLTTGQAYNSAVKVSVTIPDGVELSDYYGISLDVDPVSLADGSEQVWGKNLYVELQGKDAAEIGGISGDFGNVNIVTASCRFRTAAEADGSSDNPITSIVSKLDVSKLADAKATTGTIDLAIGINDLPTGSVFKIMNVKLLKEAPEGN